MSTTTTVTDTSKTPSTNAATITEHELQECDRANATGLQPIVFVHAWGLRSDQWNYQVPALAGAGLRCVL